LNVSEAVLKSFTGSQGASWSAKVVVAETQTAAFEQAFSDLAPVVSLYEQPDGIMWAVEGLFPEPPSHALLAARVALAAQALGVAEPSLTITLVPQTDWLSASVASFPPIRAGRFFIHGDHVKGPFPPGAIRLCVNAATAFGSGEHETTRGCLLALDDLRRAGQPCTRALDMGCGTGILAMAIAKVWQKPVLAADIDPEAVRVAHANAQQNGVAGMVTAVLSEGAGHRSVRRCGPYDIVTANILARPLVQMARDLSRLVAPRGRLILSGLLRRHETMIVSAYRQQGLKLLRRYRLGNWSTLLFAKS
jgi:ribosomal protein L11 methyltransferase